MKQIIIDVIENLAKLLLGVVVVIGAMYLFYKTPDVLGMGLHIKDSRDIFLQTIRGIVMWVPILLCIVISYGVGDAVFTRIKKWKWEMENKRRWERERKAK